MIGQVAVALIALVMVALIVLMLLIGNRADAARREEREQIRRDTL